MDLKNPDRKMSKSEDSVGTVLVLDDPAVTKRSSSGPSPTASPRCVTTAKRSPESPTCSTSSVRPPRPTRTVLATRYEQYGPLKSDTADAVASVLEPIQKRYRELANDPGETERLLAPRRAEGLRDCLGHAGPSPDQRRSAAALLRLTARQRRLRAQCMKRDCGG